MNAAAPQPSLVLRASEVCVIANTQVSHVLPRLNSPVAVVCACRIIIAPAFTGVACERSMCYCKYTSKSCASALKLTCCCHVCVQDLTVAPLVASVDYADGALNEATKKRMLQ